MKYLIGSIIISVGVLFVSVVTLNPMNIKAPENAMEILLIAWGVLAIVMYSFAKKIIRVD